MRDEDILARVQFVEDEPAYAVLTDDRKLTADVAVTSTGIGKVRKK